VNPVTAQQVLDFIDAVKWPIVVLVLGLLFRPRNGKRGDRS
jgi:hypothetical protein